MVTLPAAALHASTDEPASAELRLAVLQADAVLAADARIAAADHRNETDLFNWQKTKHASHTALADLPPAIPEPARVPRLPRESLALPASPHSGNAHGDFRERETAIIHHDHHAQALGRESEAHVPSAYLKYLSLRFHAGPPATRA